MNTLKNSGTLSSITPQSTPKNIFMQDPGDKNFNVSHIKIRETLRNMSLYLLQKLLIVQEKLEKSKKTVANKLHIRSITEEHMEFSGILEKLHALLTLGLPAEKIWLYLYQHVHDEVADEAQHAGEGYEPSTAYNMLFQISLHIRQGYRAGESVEFALDTLIRQEAKDYLDLASSGESVKYIFRPIGSRQKQSTISQWKIWKSVSEIKKRRRFKVLFMWQQLAQCWKFSDEYGISLANVIMVFQNHMQTTIDLEHKKRTALSGPLMTMKITLMLPFLALAMTTILGLDTFSTLFFTLPGWMCLGVATTAVYCAYRWSRTMILKVCVLE